MKITAITLLGVTTLLLFLIIVFVTMNLSFSWIFFFTVSGQILLGITVYRILTDEYSTEKEFEDFYEDHPMKE